MASRDYEEFIGALNAHGVRYLEIGAHAVAHHARPRATKDLDLLLRPDPGNAERLLSAIKGFFGGADPGHTVEDLLDPRWILQLGVAPVRIDLILELPGHVDFDQLWERRVDGSSGDVPAIYIGLDDLIAAKEATGRAQDRADVRTLRRARERRAPLVGAPARRPCTRRAAVMPWATGRRHAAPRRNPSL
jgi:hypothetical protein